jgi:hypothetical protein
MIATVMADRNEDNPLAPLACCPPLQTASAGQSAGVFRPENPPRVKRQDLVLLSVAFAVPQVWCMVHDVTLPPELLTVTQG